MTKRPSIHKNGTNAVTKDNSMNRQTDCIELRANSISYIV